MRAVSTAGARRLPRLTSRLRSRVVVLGLGISLAVALVVVTLAAGAFVGPDGTYKACVAARGGSVRIVDQSVSCSAKETEIALADGTAFYTKAASDARYASNSALSSTDTRVAALEGQVEELSERLDELTAAAPPRRRVCRRRPGTGRLPVLESLGRCDELHRPPLDTSGAGYSSLATGLTGTNYTDNTATNGTTYYYVVRAVNAGGTSANSSEVSATPRRRPPRRLVCRRRPGTGRLLCFR